MRANPVAADHDEIGADVDRELLDDIGCAADAHLDAADA